MGRNNILFVSPLLLYSFFGSSRKCVFKAPSSLINWAGRRSSDEGIVHHDTRRLGE